MKTLDLCLYHCGAWILRVLGVSQHSYLLAALYKVEAELKPVLQVGRLMPDAD